VFDQLTTGTDFVEAQHRLNPLLKPNSIAFIGASRRRNSAGNDILRNLLPATYEGRVYPVNPSYESIFGWACYPNIASLPETIDLAVIIVPNKVVEQVTRDVLDSGARALVIVASLELDDDPGLRERVKKMLQDANVPVCGANGMGFFTPTHNFRAFTGYHPEPLQAGGISYIAQSGSLLQALLFNDERLGFNLAVSSGQELVTTVSDYIDFALEQPETRVITLALEEVRDPEGFIKALKKARARKVPIIVLKLGQSEAGKRFALSHTGAISGNNEVYASLFREYGVICVEDLVEMANTALLLQNPKVLGDGAVSAVLDSGGERQLLVDVADDYGVPFAEIGAKAQKLISQNLDFGLTAENPVDAWGTGKNFEEVFENCFEALMTDDNTAIGIFVGDIGSEMDLHEGYVHACKAVAQSTHKPVVLMTNYSGWSHRKHAIRLTRLGISVLDGTVMSIRAIKHAFDYRDFLKQKVHTDQVRSENEKADYWRAFLSERDKPLTEDEGYKLLNDYGIQVPQYGIVEDEKNVTPLVKSLGFPLVAKTAEPGILHKSDVGGVVLNIQTTEDAVNAYKKISKLGSRVLFTSMEKGSAELAFGLVKDQKFGSFVMVAFGGIWIEVLKDSQLAMVPVDRKTAKQRISDLKMAKVLDGVRGAAPCDMEALIDTYVNLSNIAYDLGDYISELDINPVLVSSDGVVAVDSLIVPNKKSGA